MHAEPSIEIRLLGWSVIVLLAYIVAQAGLAVPERGLSWNAGPRDGWQPPRGVRAGRAERALKNFAETYPAFMALALGLMVAGKAGGSGEIGAWLWLTARVAYLPLYIFGVPWLRSLAYGVSLVGLILMLARLLGA